MGVFDYIIRRLHHLPAYDSEQVVAAKHYQSKPNELDSKSGYDLHYKKTDLYMFGAISPESDANDRLSSQQIEDKAKMLYQSFS